VTRYTTPVDDDKETRRVDAALDRMEARLVEMNARNDGIDAMLDRLTRRLYWRGVWLTVEVLVGFGLVACWRAL
jgi:hypothetical protein